MITKIRSMCLTYNFVCLRKVKLHEIIKHFKVLFPNMNLNKIQVSNNFPKYKINVQTLK
jgi:hypothetical protein